MKYSEYEHKRRRRERNRAILAATIIVVGAWLAISFVIVLWGKG